MSAEERTVMQEHLLFWLRTQAAGKVAVFGPVHDPAGTFGVVEAESEAALRTLLEGDPASTLDHYEIRSMQCRRCCHHRLRPKENANEPTRTRIV